MRQFSCFATLLLFSLVAMASPINNKTARIVGTHYLQSINMMNPGDSLTLIDQKSFTDPVSGNEVNTFYVFNYGQEGFVIVSADNRCLPVLGYSMNGSYDANKLPVNMKSWLEELSQDIQNGIIGNYPENKEYQELWDKLSQGTIAFPESTKDNDYLISSTWEQGYGYDNYTPSFDGAHAVVGCVATAMSQIIRYWGAPTRGFGKKTYNHSYYGQLSVDFDTTDFDYSLMPDKVTWRSSESQIEMTSRLCYYCGVVVNMNYENPTYTEGSGAQASKVPEGLLYFGYTDATHWRRNDVNDDDLWKDMIVNEIDNLRPIEYSGHSNSGGHAFILDGYRQRNQNMEYHFNWGWGGYGDGFYTLSTMMGYTNTHEMTTNIYPSGWDGHLEKFHVSPDGNGDGTSWEQANSRLDAAVKINTLSARDIWMKEGHYYGDTNEIYAYTITSPATIYGGFSGNETATSQRVPKEHPTIIDGQGSRSLLKGRLSNSSTKIIIIYDIEFQNGYSVNEPCITLNGNIQANGLKVSNCESDSSSIMHTIDCRVRHSIIEGNEAPVILDIDGAAIRQSLINNNNSKKVLDLYSAGRVVNCDIVSNHGTAVTINNKKNTFINNIVWNNDSSIRIASETYDTTLRNNAFVSDTAIGDSTNILISPMNEDDIAPRFTQPTTCGIDGISADADWHLMRGSACIDAGARISESMSDGDLDQNLRCRNGIIDLGCYESNYPAGISPVDNWSISIYPNPATNSITLEGYEGNDATIFDINGRPVLQVTVGSAIDIQGLPKGVYYLRCQGTTKKFVKQ